MNVALGNAERIHATREAVSDLRRAGLLDEAGAARAEALWPEPGPRAGWLGRVLAAVFVSGAIGMLTSFVAILLHVRSFTGISVASTLLLAFATERILASPRFAFSGAAGTTGFYAWVSFVTASAALLDSGRAAIGWVLVLAALAGAAAVFRWGFPLHAFLGTAALFAALARLPEGRLVWVAAALVIAAVVAPLLDRPAAPPHRDALAVLLATALAALYAALNVSCLDEKIVEEIGGRGSRPDAMWRTFAWAGTFLVPLLVTAWGAVSRRRWLLGLGAALVVLSAITLRQYVHFVALWAVLVAGGAAVALLALGLIRLLKRERWGYTDEPLFSRPGRGEALSTVLLVASQLPGSRDVARERDDGSRFASGGGDSGGGGASDSF